MKITKLLLCLMLVAPIVNAKEQVSVIYDFPITRVIDGDTVAFEANFLPMPLKQELSIRVFGVDTPEKSWRAECEDEALQGEAASAFTKQMLKDSKIQQVSIIAWDKYGGRVLGDVLLDGRSLRMMLLEKGYAREYYGKKKESWCALK
tara:strand:- start:1212 stop:1655 length:444 start_codon:yes stop_codon:yes gene_type:complete